MFKESKRILVTPPTIRKKKKKIIRKKERDNTKSVENNGIQKIVHKTSSNHSSLIYQQVCTLQVDPKLVQRDALLQWQM